MLAPVQGAPGGGGAGGGGGGGNAVIAAYDRYGDASPIDSIAVDAVKYARYPHQVYCFVCSLWLHDDQWRDHIYGRKHSKRRRTEVVAAAAAS